MIISSFLSNAAVAIVFTPIAIAISNYSGIDPRPLIFSVCLGASNSFLTPIGYQTNMMVYAPGQYRFNDFIKIGLPLSIIFSAAWTTAEPANAAQLALKVPTPVVTLSESP